MKLKNELPTTIAKFKEFGREKIISYANYIKENHRYNCLLTRVSWDMFQKTYTNDEINEMYDKYDCNDSHVSTLLRRAFQELNIEI